MWKQLIFLHFVLCFQFKLFPFQSESIAHIRLCLKWWLDDISPIGDDSLMLVMICDYLVGGAWYFWLLYLPVSVYKLKICSMDCNFIEWLKNQVLQWWLIMDQECVRQGFPGMMLLDPLFLQLWEEPNTSQSWSAWTARKPTLENRPSRRREFLNWTILLSTESSTTGKTWLRFGIIASLMSSESLPNSTPVFSLKVFLLPFSPQKPKTK